MPKVRLLVSRDIDGKPNAAGAEVDVSDEVAADLRSSGSATLIEDEKKAEAAANEGNYTTVTARDDTVQTKPSSTSKEKK